MGWLELFNNWVSPIETIFGLITSLAVFWTWWEVIFGMEKRRRLIFERARKQHGSNPSILIVDLLANKEADAKIENYCANTEALKNIPKERIFKISRMEWLKPDDAPGLVNELRENAASIIKIGTDTVHLFYAGPVAPVAIIGAEFANICNLIIYQHNKTTYENWGPIKHDYT